MTKVEVVPAEGRAGLLAFIEAARRAEAANPRWVEPLHEEIRTTFDARRAPFLSENVVQPFVAFRDGEPVGRIVATVAAAHQQKFGDSCGFFGLLEAVDDPTVFEALFSKAEDFLRGRGMRVARGPFSLTINHESGLLVEGFDEPHTVRTNHAPPYYGARIEALGYRKALDLLAFACRVSESDLPERVAASAARLPFDPEIRIERLSYRSWGRDFPRVLALYNDAWANNAWATPVSEAEARFIARVTLPACKPSWIQIATWRGEDVAVVVHVPDANEALAGLEGRLLPFGFARFVWRIHVRGARRSRVVMLGAAGKWRRTRIGAMAVSRLMARTVEDARAAGVEEIEYSWILETNREMINLAARPVTRRTRTFRIYEKPL